MSRWQGETGRPGTPVIGIRTMVAEDIPAVTAVDAAAFGSNRMFLVESLFRRLPQRAFVIQDNTGFVMARPVRVATQIGPIVAANEDAAAALLDAAHRPDQWAGISRPRRRTRHYKAPPPATRLFGAAILLADGLELQHPTREPHAIVCGRWTRIWLTATAPVNGSAFIA